MQSQLPLKNNMSAVGVPAQLFHENRSDQCTKRARQQGQMVLDLICQIFKFSKQDLLQKNRGFAALAFARQIAMYLIHVGCGCSFSLVGEIIGRDRTTVAHACELIEEKRDQADFDWAMDVMEMALKQSIQYDAFECHTHQRCGFIYG